MYFKKPLIPTDKEYIFQLAPIPVYQRVYDDAIASVVHKLGLDSLTPQQKLMGQELPEIGRAHV